VVIVRDAAVLGTRCRPLHGHAGTESRSASWARGSVLYRTPRGPSQRPEDQGPGETTRKPT
jgi:hypothetical protein